MNLQLAKYTLLVSTTFNLLLFVLPSSVLIFGLMLSVSTSAAGGAVSDCVFLFFLQHKMEREWILSVLEEGLSDGHCYELCDQQGIFQTLLGFGSSPLCDEHCQVHAVGVTQHISSKVKKNDALNCSP